MNYAIFLLLLGVIFNDTKKGICLIAAYSPILLMLRLANSVSVYQALTIIAFVIFYVKYSNDRDEYYSNFPLKPVIVVAFISLFLTNYFKESYWINACANMFSQYLIMVPFYCVMQDEKNQDCFYSHIKLLMWIVCLYGLIEFILQSNPFTEWFFNTSYFIGYGADRSDDIRLGTIRCHSILKEVSTFAVFNSMTACLLFTKIYRNNLKTILQEKKYVLDVILLLLLIFGIVVTVTRSSYVAFAGGLLVISFSKSKAFRISLLLVLIVVYIMFGDYIDILSNSLTSSESEIHGSSADLRRGQIDVVLYLLSQSPLIGHGAHAVGDAQSVYSALYGAESIWFVTLINYGFLGAIVLLIFAFQSSFFSIKAGCLEALAVVVVFFVSKTLSITPGIDLSFCFFLWFMTMKFSEKNRLEII